MARYRKIMHVRHGGHHRKLLPPATQCNLNPPTLLLSLQGTHFPPAHWRFHSVRDGPHIHENAEGRDTAGWAQCKRWAQRTTLSRRQVGRRNADSHRKASQANLQSSRGPYPLSRARVRACSVYRYGFSMPIRGDACALCLATATAPTHTHAGVHHASPSTRMYHHHCA